VRQQQPRSKALFALDVNPPVRISCANARVGLSVLLRWTRKFACASWISARQIG